MNEFEAALTSPTRFYKKKLFLINLLQISAAKRTSTTNFLQTQKRPLSQSNKIHISLNFQVVKPMWRSRRADLVPAFATFALCLTVGVELGILAGVAVNVLLLLYPSARPQLDSEIVTVRKAFKCLEKKLLDFFLYNHVDIYVRAVLRYKLLILTVLLVLVKEYNLARSKWQFKMPVVK